MIIFEYSSLLKKRGDHEESNENRNVGNGTVIGDVLNCLGLWQAEGRLSHQWRQPSVEQGGVEQYPEPYQCCGGR